MVPSLHIMHFVFDRHNSGQVCSRGLQRPLQLHWYGWNKSWCWAIECLYERWDRKSNQSWPKKWYQGHSESNMESGRPVAAWKNWPHTVFGLALHWDIKWSFQVHSRHNWKQTLRPKTETLVSKAKFPVLNKSLTLHFFHTLVESGLSGLRVVSKTGHIFWKCTYIFHQDCTLL